jgi:hypothetical protein
MHRRTFLALPAIAGSALSKQPNVDPGAIDHDRILRAANKYLREEPVTVSASSSSKSAGGKHAYFSEGDYWWPDPKNPKAPYIRRDGISNPANFDEHRKALMRLSIQVPALVAAWKITRETATPTTLSAICGPGSSIPKPG